MINIKFAGASGGEVTGSKHLIKSSKGKILLDCGLFQGKRSESIIKNKKFSFDPKSLNCVIISHAHIDHTGALPVLVKNGFSSDIYINNITAEFSRIMLIDSARLQEEDAKFYNKIHKDRGDFIEPLYNEDDVNKVFDKFKPVKRNEIYFLFENAYFKFLNAGHVLGSNLVYLIIDGIKILYSGDIGRREQLILKQPEFNEDVDYLMIESTYGNREHPNIGDVYEIFKSLIIEITKNKSKLIIPSFSLERTQEIIYLFDKLRHDNIPKIPIYVDIQ